MTNQDTYLQDIAQIKSMMQKSSKFLSLSGLSGVLIGIYALIGAFLAYEWLDYGKETFTLTVGTKINLFILACTILLLALATSITLTVRNSKIQNQKVWNYASKQMMLHMSIPLLAGGIICGQFLLEGFAYWIPPLTLVFYGLALVNASKYTFRETYYLGLSETLTGLIALFIQSWSLIFWAIGFGILHIVYGMIMYRKYKQ